MFDRLIESDRISADFKPRRRYFLISTLVVGSLFISAVVISLYAADIGLGNDSYELSAIIAPVQPPAEVPEQPRPDKPRRIASSQTIDRPMRIIKQAPIDATPPSIPPVSTIPNKFLSLPPGLVQLGPSDIDRPPAFGPLSEKQGTGSGDDNDARPPRGSEIVTNTDTEPEPPRPVRPRSLGVVNGIAIDLPKPSYPPAAIAVNAQGKVDVQITIDERGSVVSARAVDGPALLRQVSEQAALRARFKPTLLSNIPVKATGIIVYNFTRN